MKTKPPVRDLTAARAHYAQYLERVAALIPHQQYADRVARATQGRGKTPVQPLATMGCNGGPLLCDHCRKPIVLEDRPFRGVNADVAWRQNPVPGWQSYILGGVVIHVEMNGTLRVYHGHPGDGCCRDATVVRDAAYDRFVRNIPPGALNDLRLFLTAEFPALDAAAVLKLVGDVAGVLWGFDPGIGVNRPDCLDQ